MQDQDRVKRDRKSRHATGQMIDGLEVSTGMGTLRAHGGVAVIILCCSMFFGAIGYMIKDFDSKATDRSNATDKKMDAVTKKMEEIVFVMVMDDKQRREMLMRLDMPDTLRSRLR